MRAGNDLHLCPGGSAVSSGKIWTIDRSRVLFCSGPSVVLGRVVGDSRACGATGRKQRAQITTFAVNDSGERIPVPRQSPKGLACGHRVTFGGGCLTALGPLAEPLQ